MLVGLLEKRVSIGKKRKAASRAVLTLAGDHSLSQSQQEVQTLENRVWRQVTLDMFRFLIQSLAEVALHCLCELGVALPHFNCFEDIVGILVPRMVSSSLEGKVSWLVCLEIDVVSWFWLFIDLCY